MLEEDLVNFYREYKSTKGGAILSREGLFCFLYKVPDLNLDSLKMIEVEDFSEDNILDVLKKNEIDKNLDFLSVSIRSLEYWIVKKIITEYRPGILTISFNAHLPIDKEITVLKAVSVRDLKLNYHGAAYGCTVKALETMLNNKGYKLVRVYKEHEDCVFVNASLARNFTFNKDLLYSKQKKIKPTLNQKDFYSSFIDCEELVKTSGDIEKSIESAKQTLIKAKHIQKEEWKKTLEIRAEREKIRIEKIKMKKLEKLEKENKIEA